MKTEASFHPLLIYSGYCIHNRNHSQDVDIFKNKTKRLKFSEFCSFTCVNETTHSTVIRIQKSELQWNHEKQNKHHCWSKNKCRWARSNMKLIIPWIISSPWRTIMWARVHAQQSSGLLCSMQPVQSSTTCTVQIQQQLCRKSSTVQTFWCI